MMKESEQSSIPHVKVSLYVYIFFFLFRIDVEGALALRRTRASIFTQKQCNLKIR